jgi:hypothetical protein
MVTFGAFCALSSRKSANEGGRRRSRPRPIRSSSKRPERRRNAGIHTRSRWIGLFLAATLSHAVFSSSPTWADDASPFEKLAGRWLGEGRLGMRDGVTESVKCRVTYLVPEHAKQVRQTIRCASESGSVEVQSTVTYASGTLSGSWKELSRNMSGEVTGRITPTGFKVAIKGSELSANMDIIMKDDAKQIIEIQFLNSSLIGLTIVLTKG